MLRRVIVALALCAASAACIAPTSASADEFNPFTQSHYGACARETLAVPQAVHDFALNGVADQLARLTGVHGGRHPLVKQLRMQMVVGTVVRETMTGNHGCNGLGVWFPVGLRKMNKGEHVGVVLPEKLRRRVCLHRNGHCKRIVLGKHVVFPTNCWNPNIGRVQVAVYIHKRRRHHHHHKRKPKRKVAAQKEEAPPPSPTPTPTPPAPAPPAPAPVAPTPTPAPSATAVLSCKAAAVIVTLSNASSATAGASFTVDGTSHGPIAAGQSETVEVKLTPGEKLALQVMSGTTTLIAEQVVNACKAEPSATVEPAVCLAEEREYEGTKYTFPLGEAEVTILLRNGASGGLPASFTIEWTPPEGGEFFTSPEPPETTSGEYGPLAPGESKEVTIKIESALGLTPVKVFSGGQLIAEEAFPPSKEEEEQQYPPPPRCAMPA